MTQETSAPVDTDWNRQLADAFAVLLGRPLSTYDQDAVYAASAHGNLMYETGFRQDAAWVRPGALGGAEPVVWDCCLFDDSDRTPVFDASRSVFELTPGNAESALPAEFTAAVAAACFSSGLIRGADLAPLVQRYGVDLADPAFAGAWTVFFPRLLSDGTLLGALKAALDTGDGPGDLVPFEVEPAEDRAEALAAIAHPGLRAHTAYFCTDGEEGMMLLAEEERGSAGLSEQGCEPIAAWEDGHGQIDITVIRLSPLVAGA
ncbi:hypothetical protein ACWDR0_03670 [Streptomyces sp. NPDC003691]